MSSEPSVKEATPDVDPQDPRQLIRALLARGRVATVSTLATLALDHPIVRHRNRRRRTRSLRMKCVTLDSWAERRLVCRMPA